MTVDVNDKPTENVAVEDERSFFLRGASLGLLGGALVALLLISVWGTAASLFDDLFGSSEVAVAAEESAGGADDPLVATGRGLTTPCVGCHTTDGVDGVGPSWQGLNGMERDLESGETVVADADYIRNSIVDPSSQIVSGFSDQMPSGYGDTFTDEELDALVAYLQSL